MIFFPFNKNLPSIVFYIIFFSHHNTYPQSRKFGESHFYCKMHLFATAMREGVCCLLQSSWYNITVGFLGHYLHIITYPVIIMYVNDMS